MKILLFGKNGQLGTELQSTLPPLGQLIALDRAGADGMSGDLAEPAAVAKTVRAIRPDAVVNAAAYTQVDKAETEPAQSYAVNASAPAALAIACRDIGALFVHYSTDYVFSGKGSKPWTEDDVTEPLNEYGRGKLAGEVAIRESGCRYLVFRTSWVYSCTGKNFLKTMLKLAAERDEIRVVDDQRGAPTSAGLVAELTAAALRRREGPDDLSGIYHLAAQGETTWFGFATAIIDCARQAGWPVRVPRGGIVPVSSREFPSAAKRPGNSRLSCRKLEAALGTAIPGWQAAIPAVVDCVMKSENAKSHAHG